MRLTEFLPFFLQWNQGGPQTKKDYAKVARYWVNSVGDSELDMSVETNNNLKVAAYKFFASKDHLDQTTYNNYKRRLGAIFNAAKKHGFIYLNPCDLIPSKRPTTEEGGLKDEHEVKTIPNDIIKSILSSIEKFEPRRYYLAIKLIRETGARPIEICRLRRHALSFDEIGASIFIEITKTGNPRHVYFDKEFGLELAQFTKYEPGEYLIPRNDGLMMLRGQLTKIWTKHAENFRTPDRPNEPITLYWLRHTKATKSKIQDWIDYAKAVIDRSIEVDQADKNKIAETKDKIKKLYDLAGKEFNTESDQGSLEINNFILHYKIEGSGYVSTKIHIPSYKVDQISLFEALTKGGF